VATGSGLRAELPAVDMCDVILTIQPIPQRATSAVRWPMKAAKNPADGVNHPSIRLLSASARDAVQQT